MIRRTWHTLTLIVIGLALPIAAAAASLTIGTRATPAIDPHYQWLSTNEAYSQHMFEALVERDERAHLLPSLATSWRQVDPTTWEFKLRQGVTFQDGTPFTAEDVVFSFHRAATLPNNPNPYTANIRSITSVAARDSHTVQIKTSEPDPLLPGPLASIFIVSHIAAKDATPADFRSGKAAVGTGPYKFVSYTPADRLVLARNPTYWGGKPEWDTVTFRIISDDSARLAALLAGDVDEIDFVPPDDVQQLRARPNVTVSSGPSDRLMYLMADVGRSPTPYATDLDGKVLAKNPLQDLRVRQAMAMGIDRDALVSRVMDGMADPVSEMMPPGFIGYDPSIPKIPYDPAKAHALLAEAGYPNGFGLTLHCSNNRYVNDGRVCQAVGQMLAKVGLKMKVETMPLNVYFPKIAAPASAFSLILMGWGNSSTGTASGFLTSILHSYDAAKRMGHANRAYYTNPEYDRMAEEAVTEPDAAKREQKMQAAIRYITAQYITIPLYVQYVILATRKGLVASTRVDEETLAMEAHPAK